MIRTPTAVGTPEAVSADITSQLLRATPPGNDETVAALLLAVAWLQGCDRLVAPPASLGTLVTEAMRRLPRQHDPRLDMHPGSAWLMLASLADFIGAFEIARVLLQHVERLLERHREEEADVAPASGQPEHATLTLLAIVQARRGRIARQRGDVESAVEWYRDGLRLVRHIPKGDGWATCTLGLATCAQSSGNFPDTLLRCLAILRVQPLVAEHSRFGAHLTLAVCHRRLGDFELALHHAWAAFDLAEQQTDTQSQCLINVAEIALQLGHALAARNGFRVLLANVQPERNRIPAHAGLLAAETLLWQREPGADAAPVHARITALLADAETCHVPYERIKAMVAVLDAAIVIGGTEQATHVLARVDRELGDAANGGTTFHEFDFRVDGLRQRLAMLMSDVPTADIQVAEPAPTAAPQRLNARATHAVERLNALTTHQAAHVS